MRSFLQGSWVQPLSQEPGTLCTKKSSFLSPQKGKGSVLGCAWGICLPERPRKVVWRQLSATASLLFLDSVPHATAPRGGERHKLMGGSKETPPHGGKGHQSWLIKTLRWFFRSCANRVQEVAETLSVISKTLCWIFRGSGLLLKALVVLGLV